MRTDRYDINAKAASDVPRAQRMLMMQALLEDRFGLVLKTEEREMDVYVLTIARSDKRLGPDLRPAGDCRSPSAVGAFGMPKSSTGLRPSFGATCETIATLATGPLQRALKASVVDRTGLSGMWTYVVAHSGLQLTAGPDGGGVQASDPPSLFKAVEEQLGLRLTRGKGAGEVLAIVSIRRPTEN